MCSCFDTNSTIAPPKSDELLSNLDTCYLPQTIFDETR